MTQPAHVDFWFDPSCPYTWLTSRWLLHACEVRPLTPHWHVMSLTLLNEGREEDPEGDAGGYLLRPVRISAGVAEEYGEEALGRFYTALGSRLHEREEFRAGVFEDALEDAGLPGELAAAAESDRYDAALRASHGAAVALVGRDVGTPVVAVRRRAGTVAFFGPCVSSAPSGEAAGRLWDGTLALAEYPGFFELRRSPGLSDPHGAS